MVLCTKNFKDVIVNESDFKFKCFTLWIYQFILNINVECVWMQCSSQ